MEVTLRFLTCFSMLLCLIASLSSASSETVNTRKYTQERPLSADDRKDVRLERVQQTTNKTESLPGEKRHSANESKSKLKQKPSSGNSRERVSGVTPFSQDAMTSYLSRKREWEDPSFDVSCFVCELTVGTIQKLLSNSTNWDIIEEEVVKICILFKVEDARVCRMVVKQFQEEVHYVFGHLVLSPSELCGTVLGTSCSTPYNPGEMWNVTLPTTPKPTPQPPTPPKPKSPTLRFLQITDMHLDFLYKAGSVIDCGEPVCCRDNDVTPSLRSGKVYGQGAGRFGDYQSCDAPLSMVLTMFKHLSTVSDQFDYVIFTGDIPAHDVWNQSRTDQLEHIYTLDHLLSTYLPDKPVYYCLGNHESAPVNSYPPPGIPGHSMDWMYGALAEVYMKWLPQSALDRVLRCGSYSYSPYPGFRIISVNSNYCNRGN
ncbi:sphingomyelin phosphodiesterase, partial [Aplysia californica]|uniref:Sphingomyelin phosphodiesterase n=1 Tax=Aplysia californica TaxID=6500 RepID=A0ABM1W052_APLCA